MRKILYLHGRGSKPGGTKPKYLQRLGYNVLNPKLPDESFEESVEIAKKVIEQEHPDVVVASSRGGAVALAAAASDTKLVLLCPAWKHFGVEVPTSLKEATILHSSEDDIVLHEDSIKLAETSGAALITCGHGHRMIDDEALNVLKEQILSVLS